MLALAEERFCSPEPAVVDDAFAGLFEWLLKCPDVYKVGFGLAGDVTAMRLSYPWWRHCFREVAPVVEVWTARAEPQHAAPYYARGSG